MHLSSRKLITAGAALMTICLGLPFMAQAESSYDSADYRDRYDASPDYRNRYDASPDYRNRYDTSPDYRNRYYTSPGYRDRYDMSPSEWADSRPGKRDVPIDQRSDDRQFYSQQYGSTDTMRTQENLQRNRSDGHWTDDGYRSNASPQRSRYDNELRRSDATLRRSIIEELGADHRNVRVNVRNGVATLNGTVEDRDDMVSAVDAAYEAGARRVDNQIRMMN